MQQPVREQGLRLLLSEVLYGTQQSAVYGFARKLNSHKKLALRSVRALSQCCKRSLIKDGEKGTFAKEFINLAKENICVQQIV